MPEAESDGEMESEIAATSAEDPPAVGYHIEAHVAPSDEHQKLFARFIEHGESILHVTRLHFDDLGVVVARAKIIDADHITREIALNEATGAEVDVDRLRAEHRRSARARMGAARPQLHRRLASMAGDETIRLSAALVPGVDVDALRTRVTGLGLKVTAEGRDAWHLEGSADAARSLARMGEIESLAEYAPHPLTSEALGELGQTPGVIKYALPYAPGAMIEAATVEPGCVYQDHAAFEDVTWGEQRCVDTGVYSNHATAVASVLAGKHPYGVAGLWNHTLNHYETHLAPTGEPDPFPGLDLVNYSITIDPTQVTRIDELVYFDRVFIANGGGQTTSELDAGSYAACDAFNSLCVGGYDDGYLDGNDTENFFDDEHVENGFYLNDPANGREEPDLVGPYSFDTTAGTLYPNYYQAAQGTSYGTPAVAGLAGQLMAAFPGRALREPTLMRAVLMASSIAHPILWTHDNQLMPDLDFNDGYDDRVGVGSPNGDVAMSIFDNMTYWERDRWVPPIYWPMEYIPFEIKADPNNPSGLRTFKAVVAWDQCPGAYDDDLTVDIDMTLQKADGTFVAHNISSVDNFEVIYRELEPGNYRLRLSRVRPGTCSEDPINPSGVPVAVAWWADGGPCEFCFEGPPEIKIASRASSGLCIHNVQTNWWVKLDSCGAATIEKRWTYDPDTGRIRRWGDEGEPGLCLMAHDDLLGAPIRAVPCDTVDPTLANFEYFPTTGKLQLRDHLGMCIQRNASDPSYLAVGDCSSPSSYDQTWNRWVFDPN